MSQHNKTSEVETTTIKTEFVSYECNDNCLTCSYFREKYRDYRCVGGVCDKPSKFSSGLITIYFN